MLFKNVVLTTLLSASVSLALPQVPIFPDDGIYRIRVANWIARCETDSCNYKFDFTAERFGSDPQRPSARGHCNGTHDGGPKPMDFVPCIIDLSDPNLGSTIKSQELRAKFIPDDRKISASGVLNLVISYAFTLLDGKGTTYTFTSKGFEGPVNKEATIFNVDNFDNGVVTNS
ncbi:hypothetical protein HYFRA_00009339 [Hymenoscyphus fraxineus]|uniref:Uncharacterized protein n=1 Tax=Hymenoscyphus fraxineus TaxID=746836 RepID=A0A9N9L2P9_9HELO|nr:hypothetical protein HYFRA_00009339 [Hymenoscyphus fraxineus]